MEWLAAEVKQSWMSLIFQDLQVSWRIHPSLFLGHWFSLQPPSEELLCCAINTLQGTGDGAHSGNEWSHLQIFASVASRRAWAVSEVDKSIEGQLGWVQVQSCLLWCCLSLSVNKVWVPVTELTFLLQIHLFHLEDMGYVWILILLEWWMKRGKSYSKVD